MGTVHRAGRGTLAIGAIGGPGLRTTWPCAAASTCRRYLGSASTFTLGRFGGHGGRALAAGDVLRAREPTRRPRAPFRVTTPLDRRPAIVSDWEIGVTEGPHAAPEFFTRADIDELYASSYTVHHNSARTGVRLIGPRPSWAREDGGEAGLHPSNIHDVPYAVGALDFTGDTPIILGPDGPSLGGFVCPAVIASGELWKTGQLRPGDTVRFVPVREADAASLRDRRATPALARTGGDGDDGILATARRRAGRAGRGLPPRRRRQRDRRVRRPRSRPGPADAGARPAGGAGGPAPGRGHRPHPGHPVAADSHRRRTAAREVAAAAVAAGGGRRCPRPTSCGCRRAPCGCRCRGTTRRPGSPSSGTCTASAPTRPGRPWNIEFIRRINGLATAEDVREIVFAAQLPGARARRRVPGRAGGHAGRPAAPAGHDQVQPGADVDGGELRRHRRRVPVHLRHGGARRLPVRRPDDPGVEPVPPRRAVRGAAVGAALLRPDRVVPGQRRGAARPARRDRGRAGAGGRGRRLVRLRLVHAVPRGQRGVHRRVPRQAVGGVRRREGALAGQWRVRPGRARARR